MTAVDIHRTAAGPTAHSLAPAAAVRPAFQFWTMLALAAAGGFMWLAYAVFFFRAISSVSGGSVNALTATLCALLIGLASGSYAVGKASARAGGPLAQRLVFNLLAANGLALAFLPLLGASAPFGNVFVGVAVVLVCVVARLWGMLLPCLAQFGIAADTHRGWRTGALYLASVAGCAAGCILTAFVLVERLGLLGAAGVLSIAGLGYIGLLLAALPLAREERRRALLACGILAVLTIHVLPLATTHSVEGRQGKEWRLRPALP